MEEKFEGTKLTLQIGDEVATWETPSIDNSVEDILQALRGLLVSHTFIDNSFVRCCGELYEENRWLYEEKEKEDI